MTTGRAMGSHHSAKAGTVTWLTPPPILAAVGGWQSFDLDPCAAPAPRPWPTARRLNALEDGDGLSIDWHGRVFLNPPYSTAVIAAWLRRLADHGAGIALILARTETDAFRREVWSRAHGLLFLHGRLHFHRPIAPDPVRCEAAGHDFAEYRPKAFACRFCGRARENAGAPSVLCAYGADDMDRLAAAELAGAFVPLRLARFVLIAGLDLSWSAIVRQWIGAQRGPVSVSDAYRHFARHPKAGRNRHWKAKVRQKLRLVARRTGRDRYEARAA